MPISPPAAKNALTYQLGAESEQIIFAHDKVARNPYTGGASDMTPMKLKEATMSVSGTFRIYFELKSGSTVTVNGQIYKNGSPHGTQRSNNTTDWVGFEEDLEFAAGDTLELWGWANAHQHTYVQYLRIIGNLVAKATYNHS